MKARLDLDRRVQLSPVAFVELVIWSVPTPVRASWHGYKYRLALVINGTCALRYDNEAGKGDHLPIGDTELPYNFIGPDQLVSDFMTHAQEVLDGHRHV
jgi:hypothetical protein